MRSLRASQASSSFFQRRARAGLAPPRGKGAAEGAPAGSGRHMQTAEGRVVRAVAEDAPFTAEAGDAGVQSVIACAGIHKLNILKHIVNKRSWENPHADTSFSGALYEFAAFPVRPAGVNDGNGGRGCGNEHGQFTPADRPEADNEDAEALERKEERIKLTGHA